MIRNINIVIRILLFYLMVVNISESLFSPLYSVFVTRTIEGATLATVGFAIAVFAISKSLVQLPLARRLDSRKGERDEFNAMALGAVLSMAYPLSFLLAQAPWHLMVIAALGGASTACIMAAYYSLFSHHVDRDLQGFEWSLFSVGSLSVGAALGGVIGGLAADAYGFPALFMAAAALNAVALAVLMLLRRHIINSPLPRRHWFFLKPKPLVIHPDLAKRPPTS